MSGNIPVFIDNELDPVVRLGNEQFPDHGQPGGVVRYETATDVRPVFRLSDFVLVAWNPTAYPCQVHNVVHGCYTHGCRPVAWIPSLWPESDDAPYRIVGPATPDSVPYSIAQRCPLHIGAANDPHRHEDFRWE